MSLKSSNKTDVNTTELIITIDAETFESAVEKTYQKQKKSIQIKGFRKGKAPRKLIEKEYGEGVFYEDAINSLLPAEIDSAVAETKLDLVDRPSVELVSVDKENGVELKAVCVTKPEITISDYKGIKASKVVKEITEEDIDNQIYNIRKKNARLVSVDDRPAQMGDEVVLDFEGFFGDEAFEGGKGENHPLKLGSGQFIPGFEEQVAGHSIDEDFDVNVTFPETYQMEEYAGKEAVFKCKIKSISFEELPEINDDLVKDATEFDTVEEYKADIRKKLEEAAKNQAEANFENAIMNALIEKVDSRLEIVWEDCGAFPFNYEPKQLENEKTLEETMDFADRIINLRNKSKVGLLYKGCLVMDWTAFVHQSGPYILGSSSAEQAEHDRRVVTPMWRYFQSEWFKNGKDAYDMTRHILKSCNENTLFGVVGNFAGGLWFPEALCAQILWECDKPYDDILYKVSNRRSLSRI